MEETPSAPPPVIPAPSLKAPEGSVGPRSANSQHPEPPPARPDFVAPRDPLPAQKTLGPAAPTPDVEMSIVEETSASSTSLAKNATRVDLDAFIERHPSVSFAGTDALGLGREEVLDLLSSRTKAQRKGPLLSPLQCDALAGLIGQILDLRPGAASNLYKVLGQVKAELRTTPAVPPTPTLPAPWPAKPTPPALHGEKTSPDIATPPPPLSTEFIDACYDQANDIIYELSRERYSEPLSDIGVTEGDIVEAIMFPEDREPLFRRLSTQKRTTLAEIISAASECARNSDPFCQAMYQAMCQAMCQAMYQAMSSTVINLSNHTLSPSETSLLEKGLKYRIPSNPNPPVIISTIESSIKSFNLQEKFSIRSMEDIELNKKSPLPSKRGKKLGTISKFEIWNPLKVKQKFKSDLLGIYPVAINADIAKMYRQIRISQEDLEFQRIVWRNDPHDKIKDYQLETVTYGTSCAPFLATRIIKQLALDDQITGTCSVDEGKNLVQELYGLLSAGGFELPTNTNIGFEESKEFVNVLGLQWQPRTDGFTFKGIALPLNSMTKREILVKIFDPLGWISPFTTTIKLILQELWKTGLEWDDPIPEELRRKLTLISQDLPSLEHIQIPRCVVPEFSQAQYFLALEVKLRNGCVYQMNKMEEHILVGLSSVPLSERLIEESLYIGDASLRAFSLRKNAERIALANVLSFVTDADLFAALKPYCRVTSIVQQIMELDNSCFAGITLHDGLRLSQIPARLDIKAKRIITPVYVNCGIR
ncbi:hypothetical protein LAZ67_6002141 [Cordylochernes scorpioides]|uniref:Reverse transcriptase domain-containing protein n=1 Tax=Cordylochernes scorpioides TaxID=51811 RepID=A0ABY6KK91_9ARAC|nr:hypothetical protein LAZ67_6002141 [Cordylochernes scorpioides]